MNTPKQARTAPRRPPMRLPAKALSGSGATSEGLQPESPENVRAAFDMVVAMRGGDNPLHAAARHFPGRSAAFVRAALRDSGYPDQRRAFDAATLALSVDVLAKIT